MKALIRASGHPNVSAKHKTTIEVTKEGFLTPTGDCIIGINADKSLADLDESFKEALKEGAELTIRLDCGGFKDAVTAHGDPGLTFRDPTSMVIRKSGYVCDRTLCVRADKAAADLSRGLVKALKEGKSLLVTLQIS